MSDLPMGTFPLGRRPGAWCRLHQWPRLVVHGVLREVLRFLILLNLRAAKWRLPSRTWLRQDCREARPPQPTHTGTAVFLAGLKKGIFTILAVTFWRIASIVISICNLVPSLAWEVSMLARAIIFFRIGDQVVDVALPTCFSPQYTGTATREAWLGAAGVRPNFS